MKGAMFKYLNEKKKKEKLVTKGKVRPQHKGWQLQMDYMEP